MKTKIYSIDGKTEKEIELPKYFSEKIREDIVARALETKKTKQPYGPSPMAGMRSSVSGHIVHKRHVWKSQYGRGMSRIPRKRMSRRGTQFNWVGALVPNARGGRRALPPKPETMINTLKMNKKEMKTALLSALSATANKDYLQKKYSSVDKVEKHLPLIVDSKISSLKTKELISSVKNILGKELLKIAIPVKKIRAGIGKRRGRKYRKSPGMLFVVGNDEKVSTNLFDFARANRVGITDLANGSLGRLTLYTEKAISDLNKRMEKK